MKKKHTAFALLAALVFAAPSLAAQSNWIHDLGFDEFPSPGTGAHAFQFSPAAAPVLVELAAAARLDSILQPNSSDLEKMKAITHRLHFLIKIDPKRAENDPSRRNPLLLFRAAKRGEMLGPTDLASILAGCLTANYVPARLVFLQKKGDPSSQKVVVEAWLKEVQRWSVCDAALDFVPGELGHTVSAVELLRIFDAKQSPYNLVEGSKMTGKKFLKSVKPFLGAFCAPLDQRFLGMGDSLAAPRACLVLMSRNSPAMAKNMAEQMGQPRFLTNSIGDFYKKPD